MNVWRNRTLFRADPEASRFTTRRLRTIISWISQHGHKLSPEAAGFWKRSLLEFITSGIVNASALRDSQQIASASALVRKVEGYVDAAGGRPVHISELCSEFGVSRRSLHRVFNETLGLAPVAFLRHKRLCAVHTILKNGDPRKITLPKRRFNRASSNSGVSPIIIVRCLASIRRKRWAPRSVAFDLLLARGSRMFSGSDFDRAR